ncbi:MAG: iron-siderophore ABC transporter substrate-binding protein [Pseudomonadota bacterium]
MLRLFLFLVFLPLLSASGHACEGRLIAGDELLNSPVCVPAEPKRIVVLDPTYSLGMSLELGAPVVGAPLYGMSDHALKEKAESAGVTSLGAFTEPSLEKLIALKPDLIIGSALFGESVYDIASQIAPTVLITVADWKQYYHAIGRVTGREEAAQTAFQAYDARIKEMQRRIPDRTVSIVRITPWDFQVYLDAPGAYGPFDVLRDLGVRRTEYEISQSSDLTIKRPDWEDMANLTGETLLYIVGGANNSDTSGRHEEVLENPLWKMLPAVTANRVHRVDAGTWMEFSGLESAYRVLEDVEKYIINEQ